jgi:hypothetical protein
MASITFPRGAKPWRASARLSRKLDEQLRGSRVRPGGGIGEGDFRVTLLHGIISKIGVGPQAVDFRIAVDSKLHDEIPHHTEEAVTVVEAGLDQVVEVVGAPRRPIPVHL